LPWSWTVSFGHGVGLEILVLFVLLTESFFVCSLKKNYHERPNYVQLLEHPFIVANESKEVDISPFVTEALDNYATKSSKSA